MQCGDRVGLDEFDAIPEREILGRYPYALAAFADLHASLGNVIAASSEAKPSTARRIAIIMALAAWAKMLPAVGFFATSAAAFLLLIAIATFEPLRPRTIVVYVVTGALIVGCFYLVMIMVLNLRMPAGLLI